MEKKDEAEVVLVPIPKKDMERYDYALADVLMWLSGYEAANGSLAYPGDIRTLRTLRNTLRRVNIDD